MVVAGRVPDEVHAPASLREAAALVAELAARGRSVAIVGGGTELELGNPPEALDAVVSTERLGAVVEYAPEDQVVTVEAGMRFARLAEFLSPKRQRVALDPPLAHRATIGGIVATNAHGARRARYGAIKDFILGMTIVRPDGVVVRGGGKVVKNVAGFDVPKLMVGALGTLGMIATVTLRLHPQPEVVRALRFAACDAEQLRGLVRAAVDAQLEPAAIVAVWDGAAYGAAVAFEGFAAGVEAQLFALGTLVRRAGLHGEEIGPPELAAFGRDHEAVRTGGAVRAKLAARPSDLPEAHERAVAPLLAALHGGRCAAYPALGTLFVAGDAPASEEALRALVAARAWAEARGGTLVVTAAPPELRERLDAWGTPPPAFPLMRELKARFDPDRRFNAGRFVGGL